MVVLKSKTVDGKRIAINLAQVSAYYEDRADKSVYVVTTNGVQYNLEDSFETFDAAVSNIIGIFQI